MKILPFDYLSQAYPIRPVSSNLARLRQCPEKIKKKCQDLRDKSIKTTFPNLRMEDLFPPIKKSIAGTAIVSFIKKGKLRMAWICGAKSTLPDGPER